MKLFNLTFEESQSLVTEENLNKLKEKGNYKRFFGLLIASIGLYFFCVMIPTLLKGVTAAEDPYFTWLNLPLLIVFSAIYKSGRWFDFIWGNGYQSFSCDF